LPVVPAAGKSPLVIRAGCGKFDGRPGGIYSSERRGTQLKIISFRDRAWMKNATDRLETGSHGGAPLTPPPGDSPALPAPGSGDSPTVSYVSSPERLTEPGVGATLAAPAEGPVNESDKTVISQRPIAPPEEFYRSTPLAELAATLEGKLLDHFAVQTMIGGGGMGAVFRGIDTRLDRVVAVKVIPASRRDPETLRRFRLEAQAAARLDHPNIARVYYVGEAGQWNYIVFEFIDGINVRDLVEMEGPLAVDDAVFYIRQVAEALEHAHERDVVHRDVKPSNVLVTASGIAKLVDMGLARDTSLDKSTADVTASGVTLGTFDYISPEQARNPRDADVRSDLYSLGCTLFYMLTGQPPFPDGTALQKLLNHGSLPPPDPRHLRSDISDQLYEILMKLMAKKPSERYQKPIELVNDLLLLAELENLPRSQGPSTLLLRPSVAQRSLLETHLPWIVAGVALLGSSLWLQSIQTLPGSLTLPELKFDGAAAANNTLDPLALVPEFTETRTLDFDFGGTIPLTDPLTLPARPTSIRPTVPELPSLDANDAAPATMRTNNTSPAPNPPPGRNSPPPTIRSGTLVVSTLRPANIASEQWEPSLAKAIKRVADQPAILEIRGTVRLEQPLVLDNQDLEIVAYPGAKALLQVNSEIFNSTTAAIVLNRSKLRLTGLQWRLNAPEPNQDVCLFRFLEGSSLSMEGSTVRIIAPTSSMANASLNSADPPLPTRPMQLSETSAVTKPRATAVAICEIGGATSSSSFTGAASQNLASSLPIVLSFNQCHFLGDANFVVVTPSLPQRPRMEMSIENSLVAIDGVALRLTADTGNAAAERILRWYCKNTTFATAAGFATLRYRGEAQPLIGVSRTSQTCAYWSPPGIPHLSIHGDAASLLESPNLLALQGFDNAYDENITSLCRTFSAGTELFDMNFADGQQEGWFIERSAEREVRWLNDIPQLRPFAQADPTDFAVEEAMFTPGYRP
jgi:serine/threonine protein kinase